ncbi:MAG: hypothetical protein BECKG1743E_GA0114224_106651, partial [Candidatus Kentron sp. G]
ADVKCLGFLYLYVGRYPRNNASRNSDARTQFGRHRSRLRVSKQLLRQQLRQKSLSVTVGCELKHISE